MDVCVCVQVCVCVCVCARVCVCVCVCVQVCVFFFYFLGVVSTIGVTMYFVTSSDSGSFVDDTLSAQGVYYLT